MTAPTASPSTAPVGARPASTTTWRDASALLAILALAALLVTWNIGREGLSNDYYAAAVRSMLDDPVAFLFAGFDGGRYITIDKPPLGYQLQARVRGGPGLRRVRPPAAAARGHPSSRSGSCTSSFVRRGDPVAALVAAAPARADPGLRRSGTEHDGRCDPRGGPPARRARPPARPPHRACPRWLALAFALVGLGFELKMLQGYLVLPAFAAAWLVAASPEHWRGGWAISSLPPCRWLWCRSRGPPCGGPGPDRVPAVDRWQRDELAAGPRVRLQRPRSPGDRPRVRRHRHPAGPLRFLEPVLAGQVGWLLPTRRAGGCARPLPSRCGPAGPTPHS